MSRSRHSEGSSICYIPGRCGTLQRIIILNFLVFWIIKIRINEHKDYKRIHNTAQ